MLLFFFVAMVLATTSVRKLFYLLPARIATATCARGDARAERAKTGGRRAWLQAEMIRAGFLVYRVVPDLRRGPVRSILAPGRTTPTPPVSRSVLTDVVRKRDKAETRQRPLWSVQLPRSFCTALYTCEPRLSLRCWNVTGPFANATVAWQQRASLQE